MNNALLVPETLSDRRILLIHILYVEFIVFFVFSIKPILTFEDEAHAGVLAA